MKPSSEAPSIRRLEELPDEIHTLEAQAIAEGFRFLTRLITEWETGANRFEQPGEYLLGVFYQEQLIAVGGVSRDPFAGSTVGRLRRVYVTPQMRGRDVGKALVQALLDYATLKFHDVRLSTDTPEAAAFYLRCGFHQISNDTATHARSLSAHSRLQR
ncbi:GNAT family N-acetyltransferase [Pseudomonas sp. PGPPP2]|uniref:GNAT family N-acetyltransferase n=1 Tax=Pseudomonas sp. PGPPP2 TaxID=2015554 RepID=UPI000BC6B49E|nr:GNAT family N-acetyltransferase [Pseudomonas sp. PGPPP2]OYT78173.1 MAG: GNAT family N-acetyltransferase [Pseudomonas sp. PGPPP2]